MSTQRSALGAWTQFVLTAVALAAGSILVAGQITVPNTFVNHTTADATQVNANFNALAANALNRTGGTMTGTLSLRDAIPTTDNAFDLGSASFAFRDLYVKRATILNGQTYTWPSSHGAANTALVENGTGTLTWAAAAVTDLGTCSLRLTLTSATPVTAADVTAATNVFVTPVRGGLCAFYDGAATWTTLTSAEVTIAVPATTSTLYDVWCRNNAGTIACDTTAWTNDTTRATALATQTNVLVKSGDTTRRYIGSFRTTTVSGQTEDSATKRYVWNYYNRARRVLTRKEGTASWIWASSGWHQANASPSNQVDFVVGVNEVPIDARAVAQAQQIPNVTVVTAAVALALDSTTVPAGFWSGNTVWDNAGNVGPASLLGVYMEYPGIGKHTLAWLEFGNGSTTITYYGVGAASVTTGSAPAVQSGITGWIEG